MPTTNGTATPDASRPTINVAAHRLHFWVTAASDLAGSPGAITFMPSERNMTKRRARSKPVMIPAVPPFCYTRSITHLPHGPDL